MMDQFEVSRARVFLEGCGFDGTLSDEIERLHSTDLVKWLCQEAGRALGLAEALYDYSEATPRFQVDVMPVNGGRAFFEQEAESPWDSCFISGAALQFHNGFVHLLVEYVINNPNKISEDNRKLLYLECKAAFAAKCSQVKTEYPEFTEKQALQTTLFELSFVFKKKYGIEYDALAGILKEGYEKWRGIPPYTESYERKPYFHAPRILRIAEVPPSDYDWIQVVIEGMKKEKEQKSRRTNYTPVVVRRNVTGVEDAIDVEHEMRMEEMRKNRTNNGGPL